MARRSLKLLGIGYLTCVAVKGIGLRRRLDVLDGGRAKLRRGRQMSQQLQDGWDFLAPTTMSSSTRFSESTSGRRTETSRTL